MTVYCSSAERTIYYSQNIKEHKLKYFRDIPRRDGDRSAKTIGQSRTASKNGSMDLVSNKTEWKFPLVMRGCQVL